MLTIHRMMIMRDEADREILGILQRDATTPLREIGATLGISATAVHKRVRKMKEEGVIKGQTIVVNVRTVGMEVTGFVGIETDVDTLDKIVNELIRMEEILGVYLVTGEYNIFIKVLAKDMKQFRELVLHRINGIGGVIRTTTIISFETKKETTSIPLTGGE